jgi:IS605 OrfB family transposase
MGFGFPLYSRRKSSLSCGFALFTVSFAVSSFFSETEIGTLALPITRRQNLASSRQAPSGVDRNSVGAVATLSDPQNGKVLHMGFNPAYTKDVWRRRKANLRRLGKRRLLHKIRNKQSRRTKHENHIVSKQIVDYAAKHRRCIVVERLENVRRGKIRRYSEKSQWSFFQLLQFVLYKAALRGVMVLEAEPAYTSQECSRCHKLSKPNGKSFRCAHCGHNDHRDANAAFSLSERVMPIGELARESESPCSALLVEPFLGTEVQQCA